MNEKIKALQGIIGTTADGVWGPKSQDALERLIKESESKSDNDWFWIKLRVDGADLVIEPGIVTAFGGAHDTMDSGETASGVSTKDNPSFLGCALPMRRDTSPQLRGSPIPKLPWKTVVLFTDLVTGNQVATKLIDEGPAKWTKHIGDMTEAAAKLFDPHATANNFEKVLSIRIPDGARFLA